MNEIFRRSDFSFNCTAVKAYKIAIVLYVIAV